MIALPLHNMDKPDARKFDATAQLYDCTFNIFHPSNGLLWRGFRLSCLKIFFEIMFEYLYKAYFHFAIFWFWFDDISFLIARFAIGFAWLDFCPAHFFNFSARISNLLNMSANLLNMSANLLNMSANLLNMPANQSACISN